ncbi:PREDICTED: F-box/kelch-repeat protein At4g19865-like [Camelina sativa]|uniref:F-box/kelch-repeat protein At4g19865-like n=1 Tax=Camelina sativa TaxID=90675 RepID=A0ABM1QKT2_CAMSA|nr:PREDICTED: F-box/kelch-repeat protein At4g19865-like [Camelina sativa]
MNVQVELPEKKRKRKRKRKRTKKTSPSSSPPPSFSLLPDEILVSCLARVSSSYYPTLSIVSKSFRSILSSAEFKAARSHLGNTEQWLYVCLYDIRFHTHQRFRLLLNPNGNLPDSVIKKKKTTEQLLVPVTFNSSSNLPSVSTSTIAVGSEIYVIGGPVDYAPSSAVRVLDCCTHTWRDAPSMNIVRMNALASLHDGKIYVTGGGCLGVESCDEVFDIKAQTWERLPDPWGSELSYCDIKFGWKNVKGLDSLRLER